MNNISLTKNREKQLYSSKILYNAPNIYETYKRMQLNKNISLSELNTSRSSLEFLSKRIKNNLTTKNNYQKINFIYNINSKNINRSLEIKEGKKIIKNKPHFSYIRYLESKEKGYPFVSNEQRFKWQNTDNYNYPTGINTFNKGKKHLKILYDTKMEFNYKRQKKFVFSPSNNNSFEKTKRVLNIDKKEIYGMLDKKKKKLRNYQKFVNVGGIIELMKKTPLKDNIKGVRRIKRNNSYELNLFGKDYGKFEKPTSFRKHFIDKNIEHDIFGIKKLNSLGNINYNRKDFCKKYNSHMNRNPINWHIIDFF